MMAKLPTPIGLLQKAGPIGQILRQLPSGVLKEAETQDDPWTWLAGWVMKNPVEHCCVGTIEMRDAECAALEKEGFKRTNTGVYLANTKARRNAEIYQGVREVHFNSHKDDPAKIIMRLVMDGCWPDKFHKTFEAAASQQQAILRLVEVGRGGGSISQSWRLKMQAAQIRGDQKAADHWVDKVTASILHLEKGRQWLLEDKVQGLRVPSEMRDEARQRYEKFYAKDVRRLGRKKADKKWKGADDTFEFKRLTNGEKIAVTLTFGWLFVTGEKIEIGFPGYCFISDEILATILGLTLPLPSLLPKTGDEKNQCGRKTIEDCRLDIGLKKGETLVTGVKKVDNSERSEWEWAILDENDKEVGYFNQANSLPPKLAG